MSEPTTPPDTPPVRRGRGPSLQKTQRTRNEILAAALAEFTEVGIANATMDRIAKRANLAKGTLYLHFRSKESLLQGALESTIAYSSLSLFSSPRKTGESMRDYIARLLLPSMENFHASGRAAVIRLLLAEAGNYPSLASYYYEHVFIPWHAHFEALFRIAEAEGELRGISPATASRLLGTPFWYALAHEIVAAAHPAPHHISLVEMARAQLDAIFGTR